MSPTDEAEFSALWNQGLEVAEIAPHLAIPRCYDLIIVDGPPMQSDVTAAAVTQADLGLVPVLPSPLDVLAYSELVPLLRQAQGVNATLRLRFVINQVGPRTALAREVRETLADADIPVLPTYVHDQQVYRRMVAQGATVRACSMPSTRPRKSLGELLKQAEAEALAAPRRPADVRPPLVVRAVALTPAAQETLYALIAQASAAVGRKASASAVVRALLQYAEQEHLGAELVRLIAAELQTGEVVWGTALMRW